MEISEEGQLCQTRSNIKAAAIIIIIAEILQHAVIKHGYKEQDNKTYLVETSGNTSGLNCPAVPYNKAQSNTYVTKDMNGKYRSGAFSSLNGKLK